MVRRTIIDRHVNKKTKDVLYKTTVRSIIRVYTYPNALRLRHAKESFFHRPWSKEAVIHILVYTIFFIVNQHPILYKNISDIHTINTYSILAVLCIFVNINNMYMYIYQKVGIKVELYISIFNSNKLRTR